MGTGSESTPKCAGDSEKGIRCADSGVDRDFASRRDTWASEIGARVGSRCLVSRGRFSTPECACDAHRGIRRADSGVDRDFASRRARRRRKSGRGSDGGCLGNGRVSTPECAYDTERGIRRADTGVDRNFACRPARRRRKSGRGSEAVAWWIGGGFRRPNVPMTRKEEYDARIRASTGILRVGGTHGRRTEQRSAHRGDPKRNVGKSGAAGLRVGAHRGASGFGGRSATGRPLMRCV